MTHKEFTTTYGNVTRKEQDMMFKITVELSKREIRNGGRWIHITMKNGRELDIVRTGYGPMEKPEWDSHEVQENGEVVIECANLNEVAIWMIRNK